VRKEKGGKSRKKEKIEKFLHIAVILLLLERV